MIGRFMQGQPTVYGMRVVPYPRSRQMRLNQQNREKWQASVRLALTPIIDTCTDENTPIIKERNDSR